MMMIIKKHKKICVVYTRAASMWGVRVKVLRYWIHSQWVTQAWAPLFISYIPCYVVTPGVIAYIYLLIND